MEKATNSYITRITWNKDGWKRPSGVGWRFESDTLVARYKFGSEEWLNRQEWVVDEWRYGFLQGIYRSHRRFAGQTINVGLYTIDPTKRRLYVGLIRRAEVLTDQQIADAVRLLQHAGYQRTMRHEITAAGDDASSVSISPRVRRRSRRSAFEFRRLPSHSCRQDK